MEHTEIDKSYAKATVNCCNPFNIVVVLVVVVMVQPFVIASMAGHVLPVY